MSSNQPIPENDLEPKRPNVLLVLFFTLTAPVHYILVQIFGTVFEILQLEPGEGLFDNDKEDIVGRWIYRLSILAFVGLIAGAGFYGYSNWRQTIEEKAAINAKADKSLPSKAYERDAYSTLIADLFKRDEKVMSLQPVMLPKLQEKLQQRIKIANRIYDHPALTLETEARAHEIMLESVTTQVVSKHGSMHETNAELENLICISSELLGNKSPHVKARALLGAAAGNLVMITSESASNEWKELQNSLVASIEAFDECSSDFVADEVFNKSPWIELADLFEILIAIDGPQSENVCLHCSETLKVCQRDELRLLGFKIYDLAVYRRFDFNFAFEGLTYRGAERIEEAESFIAQASEDPKTSLDTFLRCLEFVERFDQFDMPERASAAVKKLNELLSLITDETLKQKLKTELVNVELRSKMVGKRLNLDVQTIEGNALLSSLPKGRPVVVVFFSNTDRSKNALTIAHDVILSGQEDEIAVVGCSVVPSLNKATIKRHKEPVPNMFLVGYNQGESLRAQCPVSTGPFILITDAEHVVKHTNVHEEQVRKVVSQLTNDLSGL